MIHPVKYMRRPFPVETIQVTELNMHEAAKWCGGTVINQPKGSPHIKVDSPRAQNERQTKAYVADWIVKIGTSFKVYTRNAFHGSFYPAEDA